MIRAGAERDRFLDQRLGAIVAVGAPLAPHPIPFRFPLIGVVTRAIRRIAEIGRPQHNSPIDHEYRDEDAAIPNAERVAIAAARDRELPSRHLMWLLPN